MKKKVILCVAVIALTLCLAVTTYADAEHLKNQMEYLPGTTDTVTNLPVPDALPAADADGKIYSVSSQIPQREGYEFISWTLDYGVEYKVVYVVNPDPTYGTPEGSGVPKDPTEYAPNDYVDVEDQLTTTVDYAYNEKGEKVKGTWEFVTWDKSDFEITADTTITGGWVFTPAPAKTYKYTVHYKLYEGSITNAKTVHADTSGTVPALGDKVDIDAIPVKQLNPPYKNINKYEIRPGFQHVSVTITHDNYEITIWYQPKSHGS